MVFSTPINLTLHQPKDREKGSSLHHAIGDLDRSIQVISDEKGEYSLHEGLVISKNFGTLYDKEFKILQWHFDESGALYLQSFTEKKLNLYGDWIFESCFIEAKGPLVCNGKMVLESSLVIKAPSLLFKKAIESGDKFVFLADEELSFLGPMKANFLHIKTKTCKISHQATLHEDCFLRATTLILGNKEFSRVLQFEGKNDIAVIDLILERETQVLIGLPGRYKELTQSLIIDNAWVTGEASLVMMEQAQLSAKKIHTTGEMIFSRSNLNLREWNQTDTAYTELKKESHFSCVTLTSLGGVFSMNHSTYSGDELSIFSGNLEMQEESQLTLENLFFLEEAAALSLEKSYFQVKKFAELKGELSCIDSIMVGELIELQTHSAKIQDSKIGTYKQLNLKTQGESLRESVGEDSTKTYYNLKLKNTHLLSASIHLGGSLKIKNTQLQANFFTFISEQAKLNHFFSRSQNCSLQGSRDSEKVLVNQARFATEKLSCSGHFTLNNTEIIGCDKAETLYFTKSYLRLIGSKILTEAKVHQGKESFIRLEEKSVLDTGPFLSQGKISLESSKLHSQNLKQRGESLKAAKASAILIDEKAKFRSEVSLKEDSALLGSKITLEENACLTLEDSQFQAPEEFISQESTAIIAKASNLNGKKFTVLGEVDLSETSLVTDELRVFNKLTGKDKTLIASDNLIAVGNQGEVSLSSLSAAQTKEMSILGQFKAEDTYLKTETFSAYLPSKISLRGNNHLEAIDMNLAGFMSLKPKMTSSKTETKASSQFKVEKQLFIAPTSRIKAETPLSMEADEFLHAGNTHSTAALKFTGASFYNRGWIFADTIYAGFDDVLVNMGFFSSKSMVVHSNLVNLFGGIIAEKDFSSAGFIGFNAGLIAAKKRSNNTLLWGNFGLDLPYLSTDLDDIFSSSNALSVAQCMATTLFPSYGHAIHCGLALAGATSAAYSIYDTYKDYSWEDFSKMPRHKWMPLIGQLTSVGLGVWGAINVAPQALSELSSAGKDFMQVFDANQYTKEHCHEIFSSVSWGRLGCNLGAIFAGHYSNNSLINFNMGLEFSGSMNSRNIIDFNLFTRYAPFLQSIDSTVIFNSGSSLGGKIDYSANLIYNQGHVDGYRGLYFSGGSLVNGPQGLIQGHHASIALEQLKQEGELSLNNGLVKVDEFSDTKAAKTQVSEVLWTGKDFDLQGHFKAKQSAIEESHHFKAESGSVMHTDYVSIKTSEFSTAGKLSYEHGLAIKASQISLEKGSEVQGQKTEEEALFVDKVESQEEAQITAEEIGENSEEVAGESEEPNETEGLETEEEPEATKEFKPQHVLIMEAENFSFEGHLSGGDFTSINGQRSEDDSNHEDEARAANSVLIGEDANIDLTYGSLNTQSLKVEGKAHLKGFNIEATYSRVEEKGFLDLDESLYQGENLHSDGSMKVSETAISFHEVAFSHQAREEMNDTVVKADDIKDESHLGLSGQVSFIAKNYEHSGHIEAKPEESKESIFYLQTDGAKLQGEASLEEAIFAIERFDDALPFISGEGDYAHYEVKKELSVATKADLNLKTEIHRDCNLSLKAPKISLEMAYDKKDFNLSLISTVGDVGLFAPLNLNSIYVSSARNIYTNDELYAGSEIIFQGQDGYYNLGGNLNGDLVFIQTSEIKNISAFSAPQNFGYAMGHGGIINGRSREFLQSTVGNVENDGGILRGGNYLQIQSAGDLINRCNIRSYQGAYDTILNFDPGLIVGGNGQDTDGIGLYVKAKGRVIFDASEASSEGANYIEADQGFEFSARQDEYISGKKTKKNWYGKKTKYLETSTIVKGSAVDSEKGSNIFITEDGGFNSVATRFSALDGTKVNAKGKISLYSLKSQTRYEKHEEKFFGLSKHDHSEMHQSSTPTLFIDNGITQISSNESSVDARGAYFIGPGDLAIKAKDYIEFGLDILEHEVHDRSRGFTFSFPGKTAWNTWKKGGSILDIASTQDTTIAKMAEMFSNSQKPAEWMVGGINSGISLYNLDSSAMRGIASGDLTGEVLARYGLGSSSGFSPKFTLGLVENKEDIYYQTLSEGGVNRGGNVSLQAGKGLILENGVIVHAGQNMDIQTPEIIASAAAFHSSEVVKTTSQSVGFNLTEGFQDASFSMSSSETKATTYVSAELSAGGNMNLHHVENILLDGANIKAGTLDGEIEHLKMIDKQDLMESHSASFSFSTSLDLSASLSKDFSQMTNQHSGIEITGGKDGSSHALNIGKAVMEGGAILANADAQSLTIENIAATALKDKHYHSEMGVSLNLKDLARLTGQKPTNQTGESAIASAEIKLAHLNHQVEQVPVVYGEHIKIDQVQGKIHTQSADGSKVIKDEHSKYKIDLPLTNQEYLVQSQKNIHQGLKTIGFFQPPKPPKAEKSMPTIEPNESEDFNESGKDPGAVELEESLVDMSENEAKASVVIPKEVYKAYFKNVFDGLQLNIQEDGSFDILEKEPGSTGEPMGEEALQLAFFQVLKDGTTENLLHFIKHSASYDAGIVEKLSYRGKFSASGKNLFLGFAFNAGLGSRDSAKNTQEIIEAAFAETTAEWVFNAALNSVFQSAASGLSWSLIAARVLENLVYDPIFIDNLHREGFEHLQESQTLREQGHPLDSFGVELLAAQQMQTAAMSQAAHVIINLPGIIAHTMEELWHKREELIHGSSGSHSSHSSSSSKSSHNSFFSQTHADSKPLESGKNHGYG